MKPETPFASRLLPFVNAALVLSALVWTASLLWPLPPIVPDAAGAALIFLALAATMLALARTLPVQNVLTVTALIILFSAGADLLNANFRIPFGARAYTGALGLEFFGLPWPVPLIWAAAILNSRGVARLILRPWRKTSKYGLWVIGLTAVLTMVFDAALEPFATRANVWWIWTMPASVPAWQSAPWCNFLAWAVVTLLILAFVTPWLINKQPRARSSPPDYHPFCLWLLLNLLPVIGDAAHRLWLPAAVGLILTATVTTFALRNAKW